MIHPSALRLHPFAALAHSRCAAAWRLNSLPSITLKSGNRNPFLICFSAGIHALARPARPLRQRRLESIELENLFFSQTPPLPISPSFPPPASCLRWCGAPWPLATARFSLTGIHALQRKWLPATAAINQAIFHARLALRYPWSLNLVPTNQAPNAFFAAN